MAWMAVAEAAASLGVSERTIWRRIKSKAIETRGENGRTLVQLSLGEDGDDSVQQLSRVAAAQLSMRKLDADHTSDVLAVLSDYRASFDEQIATTRRSVRRLTALVFFLVIAFGVGSWFHFEKTSQAIWEHGKVVSEINGEHQGIISDLKESHQAELSSQAQNLAHTEGASSTRLEELVTLRDAGAKQLEHLSAVESSRSGLEVQMAEQTKGFLQSTAKQLTQLSKRDTELRSLREQNSVLRDDLKEALFLGDARLSQSDKITEYIRRSAARSIGYAEGVRQHLAYRARKENELRQELARVRDLNRMPSESVNHRESIWSSTIGDPSGGDPSGENASGPNGGASGGISIRTILLDCFNTWLFGRDELGSLASTSGSDAPSKP